MINTSSSLIIKDRNQWDAIADAVSRVHLLIADKYGDDDGRSAKQVLRTWGQLREAISSLHDCESLILNIYELANKQPSLDNEIAGAIDWVDLSVASKKRSLYVSQAKQIIYTLWASDTIVIPFDFVFGNSIQSDERKSLGGAVIGFIVDFQANEKELQEYGKGVEFRVNKHSLSWICSTDWHDFSDVTIDDVGQLMDVLNFRHKSKEHKCVPPNLSILIPIMLGRHESSLTFGQPEWDELLKEKQSAAHSKRVTSRYGSDENYSRSHYRRDGYMPAPEHLEESGFGLTQADAVTWNNLFDNFLRFRENIKGFEATDSVRKDLRVLADYIGFCVPQHQFDVGKLDAKLTAPKDFTRHPFIDQGGAKLSFPTFLEFCAARSKSPATRRSWIGHAADFFEWVEANYTDDANQHIAGPAFRAPIIRKLDMPKGKKSNKTNKKPFGRRVIGHLVKWMYAIEEFGMHLQSNGYKLDGFSPYDEIACEDYGFVPSYDFLGTKFVITHAPAGLLTMAAAKGKGGALVPESVVNLTCLRMFLFTMEVGVRVQTSQWLDRRTWDQLNSGAADNQEMYWLHLNTDKTHDEWEVPILPRVRQLLLREQSFQESLGLEWVAVPYEGRDKSRFGDIEPLFRDPMNPIGQVIADNKYQSAWKHVLFPFQRFALHNDLNLPMLCSYQKPNKVKVSNTVDGYQKVDLKKHVEHTPHACRSTFVTRRSDFIDLGDIAEAVGHSNKIVTSHYDYPEFDELSEKLQYADSKVMNQEAGGAAITSGPAFIKARDKNSALQQSFAADRDETITRYNVISLASAHDDGAESGLDLLRGSRANEVVFRDTHICPVGEECPEEVIREVGETRRCGLCQYACKSVDNLPAISAKRKALIARIRHNKTLYENAQSDSDRQDELEEIYDRIQSDTQEYLGWTVAEETLLHMLNSNVASDFIHTEEPEIIRRHLRRVVKPSSVQEFVLERIIEANEYPTLRTDELRLKASRIMRSIMAAKPDALQNFAEDINPDEELEAVANAISARMRAEGLSVAEVSKAISGQIVVTRTPALFIEQKAGE